MSVKSATVKIIVAQIFFENLNMYDLKNFA